MINATNEVYCAELYADGRWKRFTGFFQERAVVEQLAVRKAPLTTARVVVATYVLKDRTVVPR